MEGSHQHVNQHLPATVSQLRQRLACGSPDKTDQDWGLFDPEGARSSGAAVYRPLGRGGGRNWLLGSKGASDLSSQLRSGLAPSMG